MRHTKTEHIPAADVFQKTVLQSLDGVGDLRDKRYELEDDPKSNLIRTAQNEALILTHMEELGIDDVARLAAPPVESVVEDGNQDNDTLLRIRQLPSDQVSAALMEFAQSSSGKSSSDGHYEEISHKVVNHIEAIPGKMLHKVEMDDDDIPVVIKNIATVLFGLEQNHIIHRDVKPKNIIVGPDLKTTLLDFELAFKQGISKMKIRAGSPMYMSPEQRRKEDGGIQSDIFSLTMMFAELMTDLDLKESFKVYLSTIPDGNDDSPTESLSISEGNLLENAKGDIDILYIAGVEKVQAKIESSNISDKHKAFLIKNLSVNQKDRLSSFEDYMKGIDILVDSSKDVEDINELLAQHEVNLK